MCPITCFDIQDYSFKCTCTHANMIYPKSSVTLYFSASLIQSYVQMSRHSFRFFFKNTQCGSSGHLIIIKPLSQLTTAQPVHLHLHTHELSGLYDSDRQQDTHSFQGHQKGFSVASSGNRFQTI